MGRGVNGVQLAIFVALFAFVTVLGFVAARWRRARTLDDLEEWGLGGRNFGSWITWFLLGGDIYTGKARVSKITSLVVKAGALAVIVALDPQFSIDLQLIGGVIILQTLPPLVLGLWKIGVHRFALLAGWALGLLSGLYMLYDTPNPTTGKEHLGGAQYALSNFGFDTKVTVYTGVIALGLKLLVVIVGSLLLRGRSAPDVSELYITPEDFEADRDDPGVESLPATPEEEATAIR